MCSLVLCSADTLEEETHKVCPITLALLLLLQTLSFLPYDATCMSRGVLVLLLLLQTLTFLFLTMPHIICRAVLAPLLSSRTATGRRAASGRKT